MPVTLTLPVRSSVPDKPAKIPPMSDFSENVRDLSPRQRPVAGRLFSPLFLGIGIGVTLAGPLLIRSSLWTLETNLLQPALYLLLIIFTALFISITLRRIFTARAYTLRRIVASLEWDWEFVVCGAVIALSVLAVHYDKTQPTPDSWRMLNVLWDGMRSNMVSYFTGILLILTFIISGLSRVTHNLRIRLYAAVDLLLVFAYLFTHVLIIPIVDSSGFEAGFLDPLFVALVKSVTFCAYILSAVRFYRYLIYYIVEFQAAQFEPQKPVENRDSSMG